MQDGIPNRGLSFKDYAKIGERTQNKPESRNQGDEKKSPKTCPSCKSIVDPNDRYCRFCGGPLTDVKSGIALDLERAKEEKNELVDVLVASAFAVGGFFSGKEGDGEFWAKLLLAPFAGFGCLLLFGVIFILIHLGYQFFVSERGKSGAVFKVIYCVVLAAVFCLAGSLLP